MKYLAGATWEDVAADSPGIDRVWLRVVPVAWQEDIMAVDPEMRLLWGYNTGQWALVRRLPGFASSFESGILHGWSIVWWFDAKMRPPEMVEFIRTKMRDGHAFPTIEAAAKDAEERSKKRKEMEFAEMSKRTDSALADLIPTTTALETLGRQHEKERKKALDRRHRAHDRSKSGVFVGGGA